MLGPNTTTHLSLAFARVTNPNITTTQFNDWYNTQLLPAFMQNHNASLGVRYQFIPFGNATRDAANKWDYVAVYKTHENATATLQNVVGSVDKENGVFNGLEKRDIGPNDVTIELSTWKPIQTYESLREKRGNVPAGRPKVACIVRLEPREGPEGEKDVEDWYHYQVSTSPYSYLPGCHRRIEEDKGVRILVRFVSPYERLRDGSLITVGQHLDMFSMLPNYRRSTRYRSLDGSKPRWLAIHELDSSYVDPYVGEVLMGTELAHKVMDTVQIFDAANWAIIFEKGNPSEKL